MNGRAQFKAGLKQVRAPEISGLSKPWLEGSINVDRASKALAAAFGCGPCMSLPVQATWVEVLPDENGSVDPAGLAIHTRGRVVQDARGYLPKSTRARTAALRSFRAEDRQAAEDFDQVANMRADACATRVRRVRRWENHRFAGALVIPTVRPVKPVLLALSDASLDGPLEAWLMVYAAQRMELWPKVELYLTVMGHTAEVARAAAAKLLGVGRSYKDGARSSGVREATYRKQVSTVEAILWDWLERASYALLEELGESTGWDVGVGRILNVTAHG